MRSAFILLAVVSATQNVLWLPLGDSITFGCTGPTIQDCHTDCGGYRVPLAFALSQPALGDPTNAGFNITTMGTGRTGPSFVPSQWTHHCGFPGWTIPMIDNFLPKAFASNPSSAFLSLRTRRRPNSRPAKRSLSRTLHPKFCRPRFDHDPPGHRAFFSARVPHWHRCFPHPAPAPHRTTATRGTPSPKWLAT